MWFDSELIESMKKAIELLCDCFAMNGKLLICGNGGSSADSLHIVGELMKSFKLKRPIIKYFSERILRMFPEQVELFNKLQGAFRALSLSEETSLTSAIENDIDPQLVFAQQVYGYGVLGDTLLAITTSGKSKNIIRACQIARVMNMKVIGLSGNSPSKEFDDLCDIIIKAPSSETHIVQEYHTAIYHAICLGIENEFYGEDK